MNIKTLKIEGASSINTIDHIIKSLFGTRLLMVELMQLNWYQYMEIVFLDAYIALEERKTVNMRVAIHQPHYFPWLGQLDKIAKSDIFVFLDEVQLTIKSNMYRNRFLKINGQVDYITVAAHKHGYRDKMFCEIELNSTVDWQHAHLLFFENHYRNAPFYNEIMDKIAPFFQTSFHTLMETSLVSTTLMMEMLDIHTPTVMQSTLDYEKEAKNSDLMLSICRKMQADVYLSGNGARKYMQVDDFERNGIKVEFQEFSHPVYQQINTNTFVPNLSSLDILFNLGIQESRMRFWESVSEQKQAVD